MRLLCKRKQTLPSIKSFFAGFIINGIYFELIHLFLPLSIYTLIPLVLFFVYEAVFQFMQNRHIIKNLLHKPKTSLSYILLSFFAFFITYVVLYSVKNSSLNSYDTYLYHASLVSWYNSYRVVPGLAALHSRLGMNSLYLFVAAGIDVGIFDKCSAFILPCVFITATFVYFVHQFFTEEKDIKFYSFIMILWILFHSNKQPNLYYDNPSLALGAIFLLNLYKILLKKIDFSTETIFELCLLAAGSFGIKQMGAFNVLISFIVLGVYCYRNFSNIKNTIKTIVFCLFIPFILFLVYTTTNIIQTGFPLFPLPIAKLNLPWTVPNGVAQSLLDAILCWARAPGADCMNAKDNFSFWFVPWCMNFIPTNAFWLLITGCFIWLYIFCKKTSKIALCLFSILLVNLIYWFMSAPDIRFGSSLFFEFFAIAVCLIITEKNYSKLLPATLLLLILTGYRCDIIPHIIYNLTLVKNNIRLTTIEKIKALPCEKYLVPNEQEIPLYVNIPVKGDQTGDAELPCSAYKPADNLMLFEPGNLQSGFCNKKE
jgi:hypothetical protein